MTTKVKALAAKNSNYSSFEHTTIERRDLRPDDVAIDIKYCGICHSDIHIVDDVFGNSQFPMVPGHEIVGIVSKIGSAVTDLKIGDHVGVGCFVNSCGKCQYCLAGEEQFCEQGVIIVFNSKDNDGSITKGGYSQSIVVKDHFAIKLPNNLDLATTAPLLCAGITTYSPLKRWNVKKGSRVAIMGLGGLGHIAVQFAHALGAHVTVLGHSASKEAEAKQLGADEYRLTSDPQTFADLKEHFDLILNTLAMPIEPDQYIALLRVHGALVYVGISTEAQSFHMPALFNGGKEIAASNVGGIPETKEMLDFAGKHNIKAKIEMISIDDVPTAYERILKSDVKYRFVIDMDTLK